jgi:Domain of unknown function (DUF4142)
MEPYQVAAAELTKLRGPEFDRAFLQHIVKEHEEVIAQYAAEARGGLVRKRKERDCTTGSMTSNCCEAFGLGRAWGREA